MKKNTLRFRKKIFKTTKKPIEYVHVNNHKTKQDYRQVNFNNWCKANKVFCGSYLPYNPKDLEKREAVGKQRFLMIMEQKLFIPATLRPKESGMI